jgi:hypothetical protein
MEAISVVEECRSSIREDDSNNGSIIGIKTEQKTHTKGADEKKIAHYYEADTNPLS